jgi:hypothetical protein
MPELIGLRFGRASLDGEKYDPNVRPAIMQSPDAVLARVEALVALSDAAGRGRARQPGRLPRGCRLNQASGYSLCALRRR